MELSEKLKAISAKVAKKYTIGEEDSNEIVEFALFEYRRLKNDYETLPEDYTDDVLTWIKKACYEIADKQANNIPHWIKSYSENGYSFSTDGSLVSDSLAKEIIPNVGYPK